MSRKDRQRKSRHSRTPRRRGVSGPAARAPASAEPRVLYLLQLAITDGPVDAPDQPSVTPQEEREINALSAQLKTDPERALGPLRQWIRRRPDLPTLWNYLFVALSGAGADEEALRVLLETNERFPNYVFGIANLCTHYLYTGQTQEASKLLEGRMHLGLLDRRRKEFHTSEFVGYQGAVTMLQYAQHAWKAADDNLALIEQVAPDDPMVERLRDYAMHQWLLEMTGRLANRGRPRRRKPPTKLRELRGGIETSKRSLFDQIVADTDRLSREHLNNDYLHGARELAVELCIPETPAVRGNRLSWAAGILYVLGGDNWLSDRDSKPSMTLEELARRCGVSPATAAAKARLIRQVTGRKSQRRYWGIAG